MIDFFFSYIYSFDSNQDSQFSLYPHHNQCIPRTLMQGCDWHMQFRRLPVIFQESPIPADIDYQNMLRISGRENRLKKFGTMKAIL